MRFFFRLMPMICLFVAPAFSAHAQAEVLNLYSSRHYHTDARLYSDFEEQTGIRIHRLDGKADALIERLKLEGAQSPADILITVDASRGWRAAQADLFQAVSDPGILALVPPAYRSDDGYWFGISTRARINFYDRDYFAQSADLPPPETYLSLADPRYKGLVCMRSASSPYSQTLLASLIVHHGEAAARAWVRGLKDNLARDPEGGDTDQLRGIISGECKIAIANTYYFARALHRPVEALSEEIDRIASLFPDQDGAGTHINLSVAGITKHAPNRENALKFLRYLLSDRAQEYFADGNDEYPVVSGVSTSSPVSRLGSFKADEVSLARLASLIPLARRIYAEEGYE